MGARSSGSAFIYSITILAQYWFAAPPDLEQPNSATNPSKEKVLSSPVSMGRNVARVLSHQARQSSVALLKLGPQGAWQKASRA